MKTTHTVACRVVYFFSLVLLPLWGCQKSSYPCPDIHGGTEVVKAGTPPKSNGNDPETDDNGRIVKKPYAHPGMKKKKR